MKGTNNKLDITHMTGGFCEKEYAENYKKLEVLLTEIHSFIDKFRAVIWHY